jgi:hypothetical protein
MQRTERKRIQDFGLRSELKKQSEWAYSRKGEDNIKADVMALLWDGVDRIRLIENTNNSELQSTWQGSIVCWEV